MKIPFEVRAHEALRNLRGADKQDRILKNEDGCAVIRLEYQNGRDYWLNGYIAITRHRVPQKHRSYSSPKWENCGAHGGLTFAHEDEENDIIIYGFDTMHFGDDKRPEFKDPEHILAMAKALRKKMMKLL